LYPPPRDPLGERLARPARHVYYVQLQVSRRND
jgi:hypothetical protein